LFFGITFAFGTYTAASSLLAFLLSCPFILLVSALTGGVLYFQTTRKLDQQFAKMLILAGKGNLIKLDHLGKLLMLPHNDQTQLVYAVQSLTDKLT
jgi:hypothetical protein